MALSNGLCLVGACLVLVLVLGCETANSDDQDVADTSGGPQGECTEFCTSAIAACPEDDTMITCVESCVEADKVPDDQALACAEAAADCTATRACWPMLYNAVP